MTERRRWHPEATLEARAARQWYRDQDAPEAAAKFRVALRRAVDEVTDAPHRWPVLSGTLRKRPLRDFPYRVVYEDHEAYVLIIAIMHERQKPGYWRQRTTHNAKADALRKLIDNMGGEDVSQEEIEAVSEEWK